MASDERGSESGRPMLGPILYARGATREGNAVAALLVRPAGEPPPQLTAAGAPVEPRRLADVFGATLWRYDFAFAPGETGRYTVGADAFDVLPPDREALRIAYVSCNGKEHGDLERDPAERDAMWTRLREEHEGDPFALMLQGGDQLYADDVLSCHPDVEAWAKLPPDRQGTVALRPEADEALHRFYFDHYLAVFSRTPYAFLAARVPSVMMWDDHDIVDGWGSHPPGMLDSPIGQAMFRASREMFLLFQLAATEADLPAICLDRGAHSLGVALSYPGLSVVAPDLRSERRPDRVMAGPGWAGFEQAVADVSPEARLIVMSSVPALGPRLSWAEAALSLRPGSGGLKDDLRDQWQSRAHRKEWRRFLKVLADRAAVSAKGLTVVSGEIHLATRGEMRPAKGPTIHQLVASGIAHPPQTPGYPLMLSVLARFGDCPLAGASIDLLPLPGAKGTYTNERNYLVLSRTAGRWTAEWELEETGRSPALAI
ncbi:alkaline phosphatase D family protein [Jiella sp. M17.18]|uniref:alkaline phosphatase D family protein n=1 Tax=Jiella sp. M17.18 TaxID=3234247 RepID=UPI0034E03623